MKYFKSFSTGCSAFWADYLLGVKALDDRLVTRFPHLLLVSVHWCTWYFWIWRFWNQQFWAVLYKLCKWATSVLFQSAHFQIGAGKKREWLKWNLFLSSVCVLCKLSLCSAKPHGIIAWTFLKVFIFKISSFTIACSCTNGAFLQRAGTEFLLDCRN